VTNKELRKLFLIMAKARRECEFDDVLDELDKLAHDKPPEFVEAVTFMSSITEVFVKQYSEENKFFMSADVAGEC